MAFYFGSSIEDAEAAKENAGRFFVQNQQANRNFAAQQQGRLDNIALRQNQIMREEQRQRAIDAARRRAELLAIARIDSQQKIARVRALQAAAQAQGAERFDREKFAFDQQLKNAKAKDLNTYRADRLSLQRQVLGGNSVRDIIKRKNLRSVADFLRETAGTEVGPQQLETAKEVIRERQRNAQEWLRQANQAAADLNAAFKAQGRNANFGNYSTQILLSPQYAGKVRPDYEHGVFVANDQIAAAYPTDALTLEDLQGRTTPLPGERASTSSAAGSDADALMRELFGADESAYDTGDD